jgi:hypothetical protein
MVLTKITRSKSFEMVNGFGLKSWDKFGLEADITTGEDPIQLYKELDAIIEQAHKESYPEISFVAGNAPVPVVEVHKPQISIIEELEACTTYADIQSFRFTVKNDAEKAVYERILEELSPKNT